MKASRFKCYLDMYYPHELPKILERETEYEFKKYKERLIKHIKESLEENPDLATSISKLIEDFDQPKRVISKEDPYGEENWE